MNQVRLVAGLLLALLALPPIPATATAATPAISAGPADATLSAPVGAMACTLSCSAYGPGGWPAAGVSLSFSGSASAYGCNGSVAFDWDFGDGSPHSSVEDPTHVYAAGGDMAEYPKTVKMSVAFMVLAMAGFLVSIPYWDMLGILRLAR